MRKTEINIEKAITKIEKTTLGKPEDDSFWVLLRTKKRWILDSVGNPIAVVVKGEPTDLTIAGVFADTVIGPFDSQSDARVCLDEELQKMREDNPTRFNRIREIQEEIQRKNLVMKKRQSEEVKTFEK